jgi:hypothetical protein
MLVAAWSPTITESEAEVSSTAAERTHETSDEGLRELDQSRPRRATQASPSITDQAWRPVVTHPEQASQDEYTSTHPVGTWQGRSNPLRYESTFAAASSSKSERTIPRETSSVAQETAARSNPLR